ncbi:MAG: HAD-IIB family hydrolase [Bryobacterales bacterium]|nr:HAD-IIB family hydrolase [Bryobacterales bacterium]MBV9396903.1 HAD-IIB family hydrolase [Bryobacterales bacterium]
MRFAALATDYDATLAREGKVAAETIEALRRFRRTGRRAILVTGRVIEDLQQVFPDIKEFDSIVAENGATLYDPASGTEEVLAEAPPASFLELLQEEGVTPLGWGKVIIATDECRKQQVLDAIAELGLELQIIFNKGSLMILPSGTNKATGLKAAAARLSLSLHNIAGIGDAENDHAFLSACEFPAAVANALPTLKERVQLVTRQPDGRGVMELIDEIVKNDLCHYPAYLGHAVSIGQDRSGRDFTLFPGAVNLILGSSGGGKSTITTAFLEALALAKYQFCVLDPEGDYETFKQAVVLGSPSKAPVPAEVIKLLERPAHNAVVNLLAVELDQRPNFLQDIVRHLNLLRERMGRPHCVVIDEAHHFLPAGVEGKSWPDLEGITLITVRPGRLPEGVVKRVKTLLAVGPEAADTIREFCAAARLSPPIIGRAPLEPGQLLAWRVGERETVSFTPASTETVRIRHRRQYAEGELPAERSFYFRGPQNKLNLRAYNLITFLNLMEGVDDETWLFHLRRGEYSKWFRNQIKDIELATQAESIERNGASAGESREKMHRIVSGRYTLPV